MADELADVQATENQDRIQETPHSDVAPVIGKDTKPSLRDQLKASWKEAEAKSSPPKTEVKDDKPRNEKGQFVAKDEGAPEKVEAPKVTPEAKPETPKVIGTP